jgi:hypothetical protein
MVVAMGIAVAGCGEVLGVASATVTNDGGVASSPDGATSGELWAPTFLDADYSVTPDAAPVVLPDAASRADASPAVTGWTDGAIATDGVRVYWVQKALDAPSSGPFSIVSCPVAGCPAEGPATLVTGVSEGTGIGELVIAGGRIYFEGGPPPTNDAKGPLLECPLSGCDPAPIVFASIQNTLTWSPLLTTDGTNLYWEDEGQLYSCPLGKACDSPTLLASVSSGDPASATMPTQVVTSGGMLYWIDGDTGELDSVPVTGGAIGTVCTVPASTAGGGSGTLAVIDGYAYMSIFDAAGIQRCSIDGGQPEPYAVAHQGWSIETDGTALYWLRDYGYSSDPVTYLTACVPGESCGDPTTVLGMATYDEGTSQGQGTGFTVSGGYAYTISGTFRRTMVW